MDFVGRQNGLRGEISDLEGQAAPLRQVVAKQREVAQESGRVAAKYAIVCPERKRAQGYEESMAQVVRERMRLREIEAGIARAKRGMAWNAGWHVAGEAAKAVGKGVYLVTDATVGAGVEALDGRFGFCDKVARRIPGGVYRFLTGEEQVGGREQEQGQV